MNNKITKKIMRIKVRVKIFNKNMTITMKNMKDPYLPEIETLIYLKKPLNLVTEIEIEAEVEAKTIILI